MSEPADREGVVRVLDSTEQDFIRDLAQSPGDLVESACELVEALDRVRVAKTAWQTYAGIPQYEVAGELLDASEAVRIAVVALTLRALEQP